MIEELSDGSLFLALGSPVTSTRRVHGRARRVPRRRTRPARAVPFVREGAARRPGGDHRRRRILTTWEPLGASDDTAARIEAHQAVAGEGPAVDAAERGGPVLIDDLSTQFDRWPGFTAALGRDAYGAMFAFPLQIGRSRSACSICIASSPCPRARRVDGDARRRRHRHDGADVPTAAGGRRRHRDRRVVDSVAVVERDPPGHRHGGRPTLRSPAHRVSAVAGLRLRQRQAADRRGPRRDRAAPALRPRRRALTGPAD